MTETKQSMEEIFGIQTKNTYYNEIEELTNAYENIINLIRVFPPKLQVKLLQEISLDKNPILGNTISNLSSNFCYNKNTRWGNNYPQSAYYDNGNSSTIRTVSRSLDIKMQYSGTYLEPEYISNPFKRIFPQTGGLIMADHGVLTLYIEAAIKQIKIEKLEDGSLYCEISSCPGVWANENTIQECVTELRQALELWLILKLKDKDPLPILEGIDLNKIGSEFIEDYE